MILKNDKNKSEPLVSNDSSQELHEKVSLFHQLLASTTPTPLLSFHIEEARIAIDKGEALDPRPFEGLPQYEELVQLIEDINRIRGISLIPYMATVEGINTANQLKVLPPLDLDKEEIKRELAANHLPLIHSAGESEVYIYVKDDKQFAVKVFHADTSSPHTADELQIVASALNHNSSSSIHTSALEILTEFQMQDRKVVISEYFEKPNLRDLFNYAAYKTFPYDSLARHRLESFLEEFPISEADRQELNRILRNFGEQFKGLVHSSENALFIGDMCTANFDHLLVSSFRPKQIDQLGYASRPMLLELTLVDLK